VDSDLPSVTPFVRVKIPTAREELGPGNRENGRRGWR
jgi:hypothetical protein